MIRKAVIFTLVLLLIPLAAFAYDEALQKAADDFLSNLPDNGYHVMADDVLNLINSGKDFVIVDVRMPKEKKYDQGHLPGAIHIALKELAKPENLAKLPMDKDIIVHCDTGHEQNKALTILRLLGYKAYDMKWGMMSWNADLPPTKATQEAIAGGVGKPIEK